MSGKIKVLLAVLALGALVSLWHASAYLMASISAPGQPDTPEQLQTKSQLDDDDHDGLSNRDETQWGTDPQKADTDSDGFLDGEEVISGHDPRKKGPSDYLDPGKNLTARTIDLALGGMAAGDLKPGSPNYEKSVAELADAMAKQYERNTTIVVDKLQVVPDSQESKAAYSQAMAKALMGMIVPATQDVESFLESIKDVSIADPSALVNDAKRYPAFSAAARKLEATMRDRASRIAAIPVPQSFQSQSTSLVRTFRTLEKYFQLLSTLKQDPLQGSIVLSSLLHLQYEIVPRMMYDLARALSVKLLQ
jgi:hypothetical protein